MNLVDKIRTGLLQNAYAAGLRPVGIYLGRTEMAEAQEIRRANSRGFGPVDGRFRLWGVLVYEVKEDSHFGIAVEEERDGE